MKPLFWASQAESTYLDVVDFITELWDDSIVDKLQELLDKRIADIQLSPLIGKPIENTPYRQLVIHSNISILYRDYPNHILLLAIWDNRQNPLRLKKLLKK